MAVCTQNGVGASVVYLHDHMVDWELGLTAAA